MPPIRPDDHLRHRSCPADGIRAGLQHRELTIAEKGISGYKVSTNARDAIVEIKRRAAQHQFDVLLVFMFDRLGRREDETPFVVQWFVQQGIPIALPCFMYVLQWLSFRLPPFQPEHLLPVCPEYLHG
ncbi:MAG: hypothetical protein E7325_11630 [Clostridiales bacterium]|nr:hypothetical protein [Clostridiales bacterium]